MKGVLIWTDSKTFLKKFVKKEIISEWCYAAASTSIKVSNNTNGVVALPSLIPPTDICSLHCSGKFDEYVDAYNKYLASPEIFKIIVTLLSYYFKGNKICIVCGYDENADFGYMNLISEYIKNIFGIDMVEYTEYLKDPDKYSMVQDNYMALFNNFKKAVEYSKTHKSEKEIRAQKEAVKDKLNEELKSLTEKELKKLCKDNGILYDKQLSKKEIRKKLIKVALKKIK